MRPAYLIVSLLVCFVCASLCVPVQSESSPEWAELSVKNVDHPPRDSQGTIIAPPSGKYWKQIGETDADGMMVASYWELRDKETKRKKLQGENAPRAKNTATPVVDQIGRGVSHLFQNISEPSPAHEYGNVPEKGLKGAGDFVDAPSSGDGEVLAPSGGGNISGGGDDGYSHSHP